VPPGESLRCLLGNATFPGAVLQLLEQLAGMVPFVGNELGWVLRRGRQTDEIETALSNGSPLR
jgi:hypothetical protein